MKPILVFAHNYIDHNWFEIVEEQLSKLTYSGLYDASTEIYYGAHAHDEFQLYKFINLVQWWDTKNKIKIVIHPANDGEKQTMILLQNIIKNYSDAYALYYHTKGITSIENHKDDTSIKYEYIESWRHILEYFNIELWEECIKRLEEYDHNDVCGCLYVGNDASPPYKNYYAGNFWWGKTRYLNNLPDMRERDNRMGCETWVGSEPHWWVNTYPSSGGNVYHEYFDPKVYRKDQNN